MINDFDESLLNAAYPVLSGRVEEADYKDQEIDDYEGHPLIMALPKILVGNQQVIEALSDQPKFSDNFRTLPTSLRLHHLAKLTRFFTVLNHHIELEELISTTIRNGYIGRNPLEQEFWGKRKEGLLYFKKKEYIKKTIAMTSCKGWAFLGIGGIGKTSAMNRILQTYPQVIQHSIFEGKEFPWTQIVWLKLDTAHDGSRLGILKNIIKSIDAILGQKRGYYEMLRSDERNIDQYIIHAASIISIHSIGLLVSDEVQFLNVAKAGGAKQVLNFFTSLDNQLGVPYVPVGTYQTQLLFGGDIRIGRRATGFPRIWDRMLMTEDGGDGTWEVFINSLWINQFTHTETKLDKNLNKMLYEVCQGITDLAIKAYILTQRLVMKSHPDDEWDNEIITPDHIWNATREGFRILQPILDAIKNKDKDALIRFDAIFPTVKDTILPQDLSNLGSINSGETSVKMDGVNKGGTTSEKGNSGLTTNPALQNEDKPENPRSSNNTDVESKDRPENPSSVPATTQQEQDKPENPSSDAATAQQEQDKPKNPRIKKKKREAPSDVVQALEETRRQSTDPHEALKSTGIIKGTDDILGK